MNAPAAVLERLGYADIPGWPEDDHAAAYRSFIAGAASVREQASCTRGPGIAGPALRRVLLAGAEAGDLDRSSARRFFEHHFTPFRIAAPGFVTGYFEPMTAASRERGGGFDVPLYRRPPDLADVSETNRPPSWDPDARFARRTGSGLEPYPDRAAIEAGALAGLGLEIAWLRSFVDAFFIHVQGSARLSLPDGSTLRIAFDGKSGHPYTSLGRLAVERGLLRREDAHKDGLEAWLRAHPEAGLALMRENRSFIFFRETELRDDQGPLGAAGVPLREGRSLAVDRNLHTFHSPVWVSVPRLADPDRPGREYRRLMIAHDTGSAIVGAARGDLFFGTGPRAGSLAGCVRHTATMVVLAPAGDRAA